MVDLGQWKTQNPPAPRPHSSVVAAHAADESTPRAISRWNRPIISAVRSESGTASEELASVRDGGDQTRLLTFGLEDPTEDLTVDLEMVGDQLHGTIGVAAPPTAIDLDEAASSRRIEVNNLGIFSAPMPTRLWRLRLTIAGVVYTTGWLEGGG